MAWHDQPKERNHPGVLAFIADLDDAKRERVEMMRAIVQEDPEVVECIAWGVPFWFRRGPYCYASPAKGHLTIGMARGIEIDDPLGILSGTGKSPIAKATVTWSSPFPEEAFRNWLAQAKKLDESN